MTAAPDFRSRMWLGIALALTALKVWFTRGQGVLALGGAGHDDHVLVELAQHLTRGEWLGPDPAAALAHGPFYPMFIAGAFVLGVPLFLAQQLFYATACALFVRALRPAMATVGARTLVYALLLWNPMTFDGSTMSRVIPEQVYGSLGLMVLGGLVALGLRRAEPAVRQRPWLLLLGLAGGAFYLTREGVAWVIPGVVLLAGAYLRGSEKISRAAGQSAARTLVLALVAAVLPVLLICTMNQRHYGRFATQEARPAGISVEPGVGFWARLGSAADFAVSFSRFSARAPASEGPPEKLQLFRNVTHERLSPPVGELDTVGAARYLNNLWKTETLQRLGKALRPMLLGLFVLAQLVVLVRAALAVRRRQWTDPLTVAAAAWAACATAVFLHALAGSVNSIASFAAVYPLLLVFASLAFWDCFAAWRASRTKSLPPAVQTS